MYLLLVRKRQAVKVTQVHVCVGSPPTAQLEHHVELFYLLLVFEWIMHVKYLENYKCINYFYILEGHKEFLFEQYSNRVLVIITLMMKQI